MQVTTVQPESQITSFIDWLEYIKEERLKLTEILDKKEDEIVRNPIHLYTN